jgi:hypothetical protein
MTGERISKEEIKEHGEKILEELVEYIHCRMANELTFVEQFIPPIESAMGSIISSSSVGGILSMDSSSVENNGMLHHSGTGAGSVPLNAQMDSIIPL